MNFVAIDVENAVGKRWSICQIGLAIVENVEITQTFSKLVQPPQNEYAVGNINVHGITPGMTEYLKQRRSKGFNRGRTGGGILWRE